MRLFLLLLSAVFPLALDASVLEGPVERGEAFSFLVVPLAASFDLQSERNADDGRMVLLHLTAEGGSRAVPAPAGLWQSGHPREPFEVPAFPGRSIAAERTSSRVGAFRPAVDYGAVREPVKVPVPSALAALLSALVFLARPFNAFRPGPKRRYRREHVPAEHTRAGVSRPVPC